MKFPNTKLIVITTASAVMQYAKEFNKFFEDPSFHQVVLHEHMPKSNGAKTYAQARFEALKSFASVSPDSSTALYLNYAVLLKEGNNILAAIQALKQDGYNVFLILDEASHFKNLKSQTFQYISAISKVCNKVLAATATITNGRLEEIYSILKGINITPFGNKAQFMKRYCVTTSLPNQPYSLSILAPVRSRFPIFSWRFGS